MESAEQGSENAQQGSIVFVDDSDELRLLMQELVKTLLRRNCHTFGSVNEMQQCSQDVLTSALIILDINLGNGQATGLDAHDWLKTQGFKGSICFLTGHAASHPLVEKAQQTGVSVFTKPMSVSSILSLMQEPNPESDHGSH